MEITRKRLLALITVCIMMISIFTGTINVKAVPTGTTTVKIHYLRADGDYSKWNLWVWDAANNGNGLRYTFTGKDADGAFTAINITPSTTKVGIIVKTDNWDKDSDNIYVDTSKGDVDVYIKSTDKQGSPEITQKPLNYNYNKVNLKVHYFRFDNNYSNWDLWMWPLNGNGSAYEFNSTDNYGEVASYTLDNMEGVSGMGVIVRKPDWSEKDVDVNRTINLAYADKQGNLDVYLLQKDANIYYSPDQVDKSRKIDQAKLEDFHNIKFAVNVAVDSADSVKLMSGNRQVNATVKLSDDKKSGDIRTTDSLDLNTKYTVAIDQYKGGNVTLGDVLSSDDFKKMYDYSGDDLGETYTKTKTTFKVWAPTADNVSLKLYSEGSGNNLIGMVPMKKYDKGVWSIDKTGDLAGIYYTYEITVNGKTNETQDVYSKAVGVNGDRSMVVDLSKTNPINWENDKGPQLKNQTDAIIYEVDIRDITVSKDSGIKMKGKFLGLTETGTKSNEGEATGIDHLKELGVNEVHILPSFDFASIDETKLDLNNYNWGYDPKNYLAPEGSYSTDPYLGNIRIKEMKEMIEALHKAGIGVIMDSVFNHTYDYTSSAFTKTVPDYYYRENEDGTMVNNSGCGNDTASERSMYRKYMIDAVTYWAKEYHIDGFRFDLMGLHDVDTMNDMRAALDKINPHILMYGEGWDLGNEVTITDAQKATKTNESKLSDRIASFSDDMRDGVKGHVFDVTSGGFTDYNGTWLNDEKVPYTMAELKEQVKFGIVASTQHQDIDYAKAPYASKPWAKEPTQTVNYVSCHDNNTLWDRISLAKPDATEAEKIKMDEQSSFIVLTSQGIAFLQNGQEMLGTKPDPSGKGFVDNSYNSPDSVNQIDWSRKHTYKNVVNYYEGLIKLRKAHPAFRMATTAEIQKNLNFFDTNESTIGYTISNNANNDSWNKIAVVINAGQKDTEVSLPAAGWTVVVKGEKAGIDSLGTITGSKVLVPAGTSMVLADSESFRKGSNGNNNGGNTNNGGNADNNGNTNPSTNNSSSTSGNDKTETAQISNNIDEIKSKIQDTNISTILVDANKNSVISKDVFNALKATNKTLIISIGNVTWTFKGKDITKYVAKDIDLSLKTVSDELKAKEEAKVEALIGKTTDIAPFSFNYDGPLPGKATVTVLLGAKWANKTLTVARYYSDRNTYEIIGECKADANGYITITLDHCSDYFAFEKPNGLALPKTGSAINNLDLIKGGSILIVAGALIIAAARKKKRI